jgi:hypothetical protein
MEMPKKYATPGAFRKALEERLRRIAATEDVEVNRLRRQVSFDRLLARLFQCEPAPWALKGGYALELRLRTARATIDIDLALQRTLPADQGDPNQVVRDLLQEAASVSLDDWFSYTIGRPILDLDAAPYGGARYPVEAWMDARTFARFHLDVGIGDVVMQPLEAIRGRDWLEFAGVRSPLIRIIAGEQQFAEKLHAYTLPRSTPNSRVKDLIDLVLLIRLGNLREDRVVDAIRLTFERRRTHSVPSEILPPPSEWETQFRTLADECRLSADMNEAFAEVRSFVNACGL